VNNVLPSNNVKTKNIGFQGTQVNWLFCSVVFGEQLIIVSVLGHSGCCSLITLLVYMHYWTIYYYISQQIDLVVGVFGGGKTKTGWWLWVEAQQEVNQEYNRKLPPYLFGYFVSPLAPQYCRYYSMEYRLKST
jgi:hypothetical protein